MNAAIEWWTEMRWAIDWRARARDCGLDRERPGRDARRRSCRRRESAVEHRRHRRNPRAPRSRPDRGKPDLVLSHDEIPVARSTSRSPIATSPGHRPAGTIRGSWNPPEPSLSRIAATLTALKQHPKPAVAMSRSPSASRSATASPCRLIPREVQDLGTERAVSDALPNRDAVPRGAAHDEIEVRIGIETRDRHVRRSRDRQMHGRTESGPGSEQDRHLGRPA